MKITDLNGCDLEIDNLQLAIMQADDYRHYAHLNPEHRSADERLQNYCEDVYQKLVALDAT
ncbi:hypothetical protein [Mucilaginibacter sp.]|uniref:hypothetical protein n=1 Tax=Mucilaginibacter sp. TaxID=1882438 RepID=UPI002606037A|nr:hypothetical protein [Mucilaginibacter sp.]MDB5129992.1 hypothetical protein [Mucilaginibacter sp.]